MPVILGNKGTSLLATNINSSVTALSVSASTGARFPALTAGNWYPLVVVDAADGYEIMRATARSGDTFTVVRGQEGTTARAFTAGARVDLRLTAAAMAAIITDINAGVTANAAAITALTTTLSAPAGTKMLFQQSTAPVGWTKDTTHNDKALRVVSGNVSSGGNLAFSTTFARTATDSHTLTAAQLAANIPNSASSSASSSILFNGGFGVLGLSNAEGLQTGGSTSGVNPIAISAVVSTSVSTTVVINPGGGSAHTHGCDMRVQYVDIIIATKD